MQYPTYKTDPNGFSDPLADAIYLDRYSLKANRYTIAEGDLVVALVEESGSRREVGQVARLHDGMATVELLGGDVVILPLKRLDKPTESPSMTMRRVARGVASVEATNEARVWWEGEFYDMMNGWSFVPAGRILTAAGSDQQLTFYNCFVIPSPHDSRGGIFETLEQMTEIMARGGGVGINLSSLRPRHAYVAGVNGRSSGAVSWGGVYSFVTGLTEQAGSRRGALMLQLADWHPDVEEFIRSKRTAGAITNANISVTISDDLMQAVKDNSEWVLAFPDTTHPDYDTTWKGDLLDWQRRGLPIIEYKTMPARDLWQQIVESAWASAEPGLFFIDRANIFSNSWYYDRLIATNPCVTGDSWVMTANGARRVRDLLGGRHVAVVDGAKHNSTGFWATGRKQIKRVTTRQGMELRATADHKVLILDRASGDFVWREAGQLVPGDMIKVNNHFGVEWEGDGSHNDGYILGLLMGDGHIAAHDTNANGTPSYTAKLQFWGEHAKAMAETAMSSAGALVGFRSHPSKADDRTTIQSTAILRLAEAFGMSHSDKHITLQIEEAGRDFYRGFLRGLFDTDGTVSGTQEKGVSVRLNQSNLDDLKAVQRMLLRLGIYSTIYQNRHTAGLRMLPNGKGESAAYFCKENHDLVIANDALQVFSALIGFSKPDKAEKLAAALSSYKRRPNQTKWLAEVLSVVDDGVEEVYDCSVEDVRAFDCNGLVVHNCGEEPLPEWAVCNLGAVNLAVFVENGVVLWDKLRYTIRTAVRFLDNVIDATPYFAEENCDQQLKERRLGLNTMGLAEMLIRLGLRYGSPDSLKFIDRLYKIVAGEAYLASVELAKERGSFPAFNARDFLDSAFMLNMPEGVRDAVRQYGIRNVTLLTQAPNGSIGTMVGTSTGIEPFYQWTYYRKSRLGTHEQTVPIAAAWLADHPGESLPPEFVTALDLTPSEHIEVAATIQRWVDAAISKTANVPSDWTIEQVSDLYMQMYDLGCKGGTIYRDGSRSEQVLMTKETTPTHPISAQALPSVAPLPAIRHGVTTSTKTPFGTLHLTVNHDAQGNPLETFLNIGKAGSDLQAAAEGMGRLISMILRLNSPVPASERLELVLEQLAGIGGSQSIGFGPSRVASLPDAVAVAGRGVPAEDTAPPVQVGAIRGADICPTCHVTALVREEGCRKCYSCGYSQC